jgi:hypothetical protein
MPWRLLLSLALAAATFGVEAAPAGAQEASRGEAPTPDSVEGLDGAMQQPFEEEEVVYSRFPWLNRTIARLPPFLRDTDFRFQLRTYYWDHWRQDESRGQAWAIGGAFQYRSGWIYDALRIGAAVYTSQPLVAPEARGGTGLLREGQQGYTVAGQAFLEMRYGEDHTLKLYRQEVDLPYVNKADTRMTPNTFEAYLVRGQATDIRWLGEINYVAGWIRRIRQRSQSTFQSMSAAAGVPNGDDGMATATLRIKPRDNLSLGFTNHFVDDTYNTFYVEGSSFYTLPNDVGFRLDGQFTSQLSVGDELSSAGEFETWNAALRGATSWKGAIFTVAGSITSDDAPLQTPWGLFPGYLGLMLSDFDRPGETAVLVGLSYDFKELGLPGFSAFTNYALGFDAESAFGDSQAEFSDQQEVDVTFDYVFPEGLLKGLWLRVRGAWREEDGAPRDDYQVRVILNYELPIL